MTTDEVTTAEPLAGPAAAPVVDPSSSAGRVHGVIDKLIAAFADGDLRDEVALAREEFFSRAGKVFEDDSELFDSRIAAFLEWYVLERPLRGGPPPVVRALRGERVAADVDRDALAWVASSHRGLFDITQVQGRAVLLEDILGGARFSVVERRSTVGFEPGDLFEGRLVWDGREVVFGKTFLFHPRDAREEALEVVDALVAKATAEDEILFLLSRLNVRWHRLGHVGAARIYREGLIRTSVG